MEKESRETDVLSLNTEKSGSNSYEDYWWNTATTTSRTDATYLSTSGIDATHLSTSRSKSLKTINENCNFASYKESILYDNIET